MHLGNPEAFFDRGAQRFCLRCSHAVPCVSSPRRVAQLRHAFQRGVRITLHFDNGERPLRQATVVVEHRIVAVLPRLVDQAGVLAARIVEESSRAGSRVAARSSLSRRPANSRCCRPACGRRCVVRTRLRASRRAASYPRRRSSGRTALRCSAAISPRRVSCMILPGCESRNAESSVRLRRGEKAQHARGELRIEPERLQRRDDRVAPELRCEPRDAGVGIRAGRQRCRQQREVGARALDPLIEQPARSADRAPGPGAPACSADSSLAAVSEASRRGCAFVLCADFERQLGAVAASQLQLELRLRRRDRDRRMRELDVRRAHDVVQAAIRQLHGLVRGPTRAALRRALCGPSPALRRCRQNRLRKRTAAAPRRRDRRSW